MAGTRYDVVYVARSPASMKQEDFAVMVDELCNRRAVEGWRLVSAFGDYGANLTLGTWLIFATEGDPGSEELLTNSYGDEVPSTDVGDDTGKLEDEGEPFADD